MNTLRSPLPWIGGKHYSARQIIGAFPPPSAYDVYVDLFGGAAHVLIQKPLYKHVEVYNDLNGDLVNFWMQCRDNGALLQERCETLPYARSLYYAYHKSLFDGTVLEPLERAVRWFFVLRSNFNGKPVHAASTTADGWLIGHKDGAHCAAHAYQSAIMLFPVLQARLCKVLIEQRDFAHVLKSFEGTRTLFYGDPPYVTKEQYYTHTDDVVFTLEDHQRLADILNRTSAYVALSYYPHPSLDKLYPPSKWRRITWEMPKHSQRSNMKHDIATELLLMNYREPVPSLWD